MMPVLGGLVSPSFTVGTGDGPAILLTSVTSPQLIDL